nr:MAG TPA: hypothetical protein [Caudoviricetes sp.]
MHLLARILLAYVRCKTSSKNAESAIYYGSLFL